MGGMVDTLFGGGQGAGYNDLAKRIREGMDARAGGESRAENALSPYMGDPRLQKQYEDAVNGGADFQGVINKIMGGYSESPYAKFLTQQGQNAVQAQNAASGLHGSGAEEKALQQNAMNVASGDMQQYLQNALGLRSDYLNRLGGEAGTEAQEQYGARGHIGDWRNALGIGLDQDFENLGGADANRRMGQAQGWQNFLGGIGGFLGL